MSQYRKTFSRVAHIVLPPGVLLRLRRYRRKQSAVIEAIELQRDHLSAIETSSYRTREQLNAQHNELQTKLGETQTMLGQVTVHLDAKLHTLAAQVAQLLESNDIQLNRLLGRVSTMAAATEAQSVAPAGTGDTRLYLDLLEDELTGMLHQDQSQAPWAADKFDAGRREIGRDWPKTAATMIGTARMRNVRQL